MTEPEPKKRTYKDVQREFATAAKRLVPVRMPHQPDGTPQYWKQIKHGWWSLAKMAKFEKSAKRQAARSPAQPDDYKPAEDA